MEHPPFDRGWQRREVSGLSSSVWQLCFLVLVYWGRDALCCDTWRIHRAGAMDFAFTDERVNDWVGLSCLRVGEGGGSGYEEGGRN